MAGSFAQLALVLSLAWIGWKLLIWSRARRSLSKLPGPSDGSLLKGHFGKIYSLEVFDFHKYIEETYGSICAIDAPLRGKAIMVHDPRALHQIFIREQDIFEETPTFLLSMRVTLGKGLLSTTGSEHRKQRKMLNPVFSTKHLKGIIPMFHDVGHQLLETLSQKTATGPTEIDILHWLSRAALELIGRSAFGYSFDTLKDGTEEHPYGVSAKNFNIMTARIAAARNFVLPLVHNIGTPQFRRWAIGKIPWKTLHDYRDLVDVMHRTSVQIVQERKAAMLKEGLGGGTNQAERGKDILSILLKANMEASDGDKLTDEELYGQITMFTWAGMDTTSHALARILDLLSQNQDVQTRLRQEIQEAHTRAGTDRLEYDDLLSLPYLDAVCRETLRLFPPVHNIVRQARADAVLPLSKTITLRDGSRVQEFLVPKGTNIFCSLLSSNRNPEIWGADAHEWKPERWLEELPKAVTDAKIPGVFSHLMTFIGGNRACIGFKFSELEMKVVLCTLLKELKFTPAKGEEIEWRMAAIVTPVVKGAPLEPAMPIVVEKL